MSHPIAALAIFARAPVPGRAKTRLAPALGEDGAARLYAAFLADTLALATRAATARLVETTLWLAASSDTDAPTLHEIPGVSALPRRVQPTAELGARMAAALDAGVASHGTALVLGSDAPTLPLPLLAAACAALARADLVFTPSADGGYLLIGARVPIGAPLFDGVRFSTRHALADTLAGAARHGLSTVCVAPWYDVDTPDDLRLLRTHLTLAPQSAQHTARALGLTRALNVVDASKRS